MKILFENKKLQEFIRFLFVGGTATIIHYCIYFILENYVGMNLNVAYSIGYGLSFIFNYIASNYFTFKTKVTVKNSMKFTLAHCFNYLLQISLLNCYVFIGIPTGIAPIFVFIVAIPVNYFFVKRALK